MSSTTSITGQVSSFFVQTGWVNVRQSSREPKVFYYYIFELPLLPMCSLILVPPLLNIKNQKTHNSRVYSRFFDQVLLFVLDWDWNPYGVEMALYCSGIGLKTPAVLEIVPYWGYSHSIGWVVIMASYQFQNSLNCIVWNKNRVLVCDFLKHSPSRARGPRDLDRIWCIWLPQVNVPCASCSVAFLTENVGLKFKRQKNS